MTGPPASPAFPSTVAAVDLGASSGRVLAARGTPAGRSLHEVHRFANIPVRINGVRRWDAPRLFRGILEGLREVGREGPVASVGVDSWAVDYGLLDADGELLGNPIQYRDAPTGGALARVLETVGAQGLYHATGTQLQPFNTLFQLLARVGSAQLSVARQALLLPDLLTYWLGGAAGTELTNASTTQLLDVRTRDYAVDLLSRLGAPHELFPALRQPGQVVGALRPDLLDEAGLSVAPRIVSVPSHDTAAAVAGIPAWTTDFAYVCTGTWALVGVELPEPVITEESREANFTNEIGVDGTIRFLRNVTGFWLLQECVRSWGPVDLDALSRAASRVPALLSIVDVQDPGFAVAGDMPARIVAAADRTGGPAPHNRAEMLRCILDSMALAIRHAVRDAVRLSGRPVSVVHLVGGGAANPLFCQSVADACGLPVVAGPTEAASWGNALSQFQALGLVPPGLAPARELIRHEVSPVRYEPSTVESQWSVADRRVEDARAAA